MATELAALLIWDKLMGANLFVSAIAMALGSFAAVAPNRAAKIWGSGDPLAFFIFFCTSKLQKELEDHRLMFRPG